MLESSQSTEHPLGVWCEVLQRPAPGRAALFLDRDGATSLATEGATIDAVYACAHHPEARGALAHPDHPARKPNPGMLLQAASALALALKSSWLVADKADDIEAAERAGIAGALLVATGNGKAERQRAAALANPAFEVRFGRSITDAITLPLLMSQYDA